MTLMIRMARLFKADFHRVLDHIEEPEALLRHAIREMQDSLDKAVIDLDSSHQRSQELTDRIVELDQSLDEIDTQLDLCFESKKDELARGPVKRKLEANALKKRLTAQQSLIRQSIKQQQDTLAQNQVRLEHLRQKADSLTTRHDHNRDDQSSIDSLLAGVGEIAIDDTDVDVAILREKKIEEFTVKDLSFSRGVVFALGFAFLSSIAFATIGPGMAFHALTRFLVPCVCLLYLLSIGPYRYRRAGWVSGLSLWSVFALLLWLLSPSLTDYLLLHVAAISSMRALFFHKNLVSVLMDIVLSLFALGACFWAASHTGSVFLSVWSFFLVQAAFVTIPGCRTAASTCPGSASNSQQFDLAHRQAEEALRQFLKK